MLPAMDSKPLSVAVHQLPPIRMTPRLRIWKTCVSYLVWVASVRFQRHVLAYVAAALLALLVGAARYAVALIISAAMQATPQP
jgi:hypothetical protein